MSENTESTEKLIKPTNTTEAYLESINPVIWEEVASLSTEEQDRRWLHLTQTHLAEYREGKDTTEQFKRTELELVILNYLWAKDFPRFNKDIPQRGWIIPSNGKGHRTNSWEDVTNFIKSQEKIAEGSCRIMVSGIGVSGKATTRTALARELLEEFPSKSIISWDCDYEKLFPPPWPGDITVIEDVHGLDQNNNTKEGIDIVVYIRPSDVVYGESLQQRGRSWIRNKIMDLTDDQFEDPDIKRTADKLTHIALGSAEWRKEQFESLKSLRQTGIPIIIVDPSEILKEAYGFKVNPNILDQSFYELLSETFKD